MSQQVSKPTIFATGIVSCIAVAFFAICLPVLTGCGSGKFFIPLCQASNSCGGTVVTYSSFAYIANRQTQTLEMIPIPKATFTSLPAGTSTALGTPPSALAATPKGTFLYLATAGGPIFVYAIGTNGAVTIGNGGTPVVTTGFAPGWMTVDPSGNFLFIVSAVSPVLFEYQIDPTTGVLSVVGSPQGNALSGGTPTQIYIPPNEQAVYVGLGIGGVDAFGFDSSSGTLGNRIHISPKTSNGVADNALGGDNKSAFLFIGETGTGVRVFSIASGALTEVSGSPFTSPLGQSAIVVDPTNTYVYVASSSTSGINGYTLAASGALTPLATSPFSTGANPVAMSLDSTGKYLLVIANGGNPDLQVFSFDASTGGKLNSVAVASTGADPTGPVSLAVAP
ncbi:MAG: beta-propeller fold lactonase family protein [Acidobacteriaceae bacterium]